MITVPEWLTRVVEDTSHATAMKEYARRAREAITKTFSDDMVSVSLPEYLDFCYDTESMPSNDLIIFHYLTFRQAMEWKVMDNEIE